MVLLSPSSTSRMAPLIAVLLLALRPAGSLFAQPAASEYAIKAGYIYNFTRYVEWPPTAFATPGAPIVIGILGDDPFGMVLEQVVSGRMSQGHPVTIARSHKAVDLRHSHILFISKSERARLPAILAALGDAPILTLCDFVPFFEQGVMIKLTLVEETVQFDVQIEPAERRGLRFNSRMLDAARRVHPTPDGRGKKP